MGIIQCPHCRTRVLIGADCVCPACRRTVESERCSAEVRGPSGPRAAAADSVAENHRRPLTTGSPFSDFARDSADDHPSHLNPSHLDPSGVPLPINPYAPPKPAAEPSLSVDRRPLFRGLLWLLFSFDGRIPRRHYWAATLAATMVFYGVAIALTVAFGEDSEIHNFGILLAYVPMIWISLAVQVKRWHDVDKSGWWCLIGMIPLIGPIWVFVENGCLRGTRGNNRYGPDPT